MAYFPDSPPITGADITDLFASDITIPVSATSRLIGRTPLTEGPAAIIPMSTSPVANGVPVANAAGRTQLLINQGTTAQRPAGVVAGQLFYDTTVNLLITTNNTGVWVDMAGTPV